MPRVDRRHLRKGGAPNCRLSARPAGSVRTLDELPAGATGVVCRLLGGRGQTGRLLALGFTPGAEVAMMQNSGRGPVIVVVRDVRVALGRGEAQKIEVAA